jgi:hypothetical protein
MPRQRPLLVASLLLLACSSKPDGAKPAAQAAAATTDAAGAPATTPSGETPAASTPPAPPPKPKLHIQLRSTPPGAEAAVDGRPAGRTPTVAEIDDDGREHEFTFLLAGYGLERYKTRPIQSGVIHAQMRAVPLDAGR